MPSAVTLYVTEVSSLRYFHSSRTFDQRLCGIIQHYDLVSAQGVSALPTLKYKRMSCPHN